MQNAECRVQNYWGCADLEVDALRGMLVGRDDSARRYTQERLRRNAECRVQNAELFEFGGAVV